MKADNEEAIQHIFGWELLRDQQLLTMEVIF
jgi:hypothetical protein